MPKHLDIQIERTIFGGRFLSTIVPVASREKIPPLLHATVAKLEEKVKEEGGQIIVREVVGSHAICVSHSESEWIDKIEERVCRTMRTFHKWLAGANVG